MEFVGLPTDVFDMAEPYELLLCATLLLSLLNLIKYRAEMSPHGDTPGQGFCVVCIAMVLRNILQGVYGV